MQNEICAESTKFNRTSQRIANQTRSILKESWLSDQEWLELCGQVNCEEYTKKSSGKP